MLRSLELGTKNICYTELMDPPNAELLHRKSLVTSISTCVVADATREAQSD
jgi:hypothetical protein